MSIEDIKKELEETEQESDSETAKLLKEEEAGGISPDEEDAEEPEEPKQDSEEEDEDGEGDIGADKEPAENKDGELDLEDPEEPEDPKVPGEPKLILGKFKTKEDLAAAYEELQKEFTKKSQSVVETAKTFASPDEFEIQAQAAAGNAMVPIVEAALNQIADAAQQKDAIFAWQKYKSTGDLKYFEEARGFLSNIQDRNLQVDLMNKKAEVMQVFNSKRDEIELIPIAQELNALEKEDPEWLVDKTHQSIIMEAIKMNRKVDVKQVKSMIDNIRKDEREKVLKEIETKKAKGAITQPNLKSTANAEPVKKPVKQDWQKSTAEMLAEAESELL